MDNIDNIIIQIKNCIKNAEEAQAKEPLSNVAIQRLEKEIDKLIDLLKHYSTLRWTISSFFMSLSFGVSSYFISEALKNRDNIGLFVYAFAGPLIFLVAIFLFELHNKLVEQIQEYLEALGKMLGYHSPAFLKKINVKSEALQLFCIVWTIFLLVIALLFILFSHAFFRNIL